MVGRRKWKKEKRQIRSEQKIYVEEIKNLKRENENKKIREELSQFEHNLEWLEKDTRKNNIVLSRLKIDTTGTLQN